MTPLVSLTILGKLPRKSNSRRVVRWGSKIGVIKSPEALQYVRDFNAQVPRSARIGYTGEVVLVARIYYPSRRSDLSDEMLMDCIEGAGILLNDRQIKGKCIPPVNIDPERPRVEFALYRREEWICNQ